MKVLRKIAATFTFDAPKDNTSAVVKASDFIGSFVADAIVVEAEKKNARKLRIEKGGHSPG